MTEFQKKAQVAFERILKYSCAEKVGVQFKKMSQNWLVKILGIFVPSMKNRSMALGRTVYLADHLWPSYEYVAKGIGTPLPSDLRVTSLLSVVAHELAHMEQRFFGATTVHIHPVGDAGSVFLYFPNWDEEKFETVAVKPRSLVVGFLLFDLPYLLWPLPFLKATFRAKMELRAELAAVTALRYVAPESQDGKDPGFGYSGELETFREQVKIFLNAYAFMLSSSSYAWALSKDAAQAMASETYEKASPIIS